MKFPRIAQTAVLLCGAMSIPFAHAFDPTSAGSNDVALAIQNELNRTGEVRLPAGVFLLSRTIEVPAGALLQGAVKGRTTLMLRNGVNDDVVRSVGFQQMTGRSALREAPTDFLIRDLTIDGNYLRDAWNAPDNQVNNSLGSCLRIYGTRYTIDVEARNCAEHALYAEGQGERGGRDITSTIRITGTTYGREALVFRGPGDLIIEHAVLGLAGVLPKPVSARRENRSSLYPGEPIDGVVIDRTAPFEGTVEIGFMHVYASWSGFGLRTRGNPRFQARHLISESNLGGVFISPGTWGGIGMLDVHRNGVSYPGRALPPPALPGVRLDSNGPFHIAGGVIHRSVGSAEPWTALELNGSNNIVNVSIRGNVNPSSGELYAGDAVVVSGDQNIVHANVARSRGRVFVVSGQRNQVVGTTDTRAQSCDLRAGNGSRVQGGDATCKNLD